MNVVLDQEDIFKPLLSEYLTLLSYSRKCWQKEACLGFQQRWLMPLLLFLYTPTYLLLQFWVW